MKVIKRKPIYPDIDTDKYNTNNLYEYDPYTIIDDQVIIDTQWWNSLTEYIQGLIKTRLNNNFTLDRVVNPDTNYNINTDDRLYHIYQSYLDGFDYNIWYVNDYSQNIYPNGVKMVEINFQEKQQLINRVLPNNLFQKISAVMEPDVDYFVRLSGTSGKNEVSPIPFNSALAIVKHLTKVDTFVTREYKRDKPTFVILIPWNDRIDPKTEFRIFVVDKQLTAASPQRWWELNQYSQEELESIQRGLLKFSHNFSDVPYNTFVADVYIDFATDSFHFIELNPFGAHCGAGSSLFNWKTDYNQLYGNTDHVELRYLSIIDF